MEDFMKAIMKRTFFVGPIALAMTMSGVHSSAGPNDKVKSGIDRLYVIDCGDGSGPDESR